MSNYYPIMLDLRGRSAIVVGGNRTAAEKARGLAASGAWVSVISAECCEELERLAEHGQVTLHYKNYQPGDLAGAFIVIAAVTHPQLVQAIRNEAEERGQLLNIVDIPAACSFIMPSVLRREQLTIAVSTEGASPGLAKRIRQSLEGMFPAACGDYLRLAVLARARLRESGVSYERRDAFFGDYYMSDVLERLAEGDTEQAALITAALLYGYDVDVPASQLEACLREEQTYVTRTA